jgi:hypothetical protein
MYCLYVNVCCTVPLAPGVNQIAVNKYINIRFSTPTVHLQEDGSTVIVLCVLHASV